MTESKQAEARRLWKANGGSQHGPNIETMTIPETGWVTFIAALTAVPPSQKPTMNPANLGWFSAFARKHGMYGQANWMDKYRVTVAQPVTLPTPTADQLAYIEQQMRASTYDPDTIIGGPKP